MEESKEQYGSPADYLPHRSPMLLLDGIEQIGRDGAVCLAVVDREHAAGPFLESDGSLRSYFAIELIAQTVGVWAGYVRSREGKGQIKVGLLLGARNISPSCDAFAPGSTLRVSMRVLMQDGRAGSFEGEITCGGEVVCTGRVNTFQTDSDEELARIFG